MSSSDFHEAEESSSGLSVPMPSGSSLGSKEEVGEGDNDQSDEVRQIYEGGGTGSDDNGGGEGNGEVTGSVVVQGRVGTGAVATTSAYQCRGWIEEYNREAESKFPAALGCITKYRCDGVKQSVTHAKTKACMFGLTGTSTYQFCLPNEEDRIFHIRSDARVLFFYKSAFEMGFRLPCHRFIADVLRFYNIAPSQFMPNAWRQLVCILVVCVYYNLQPSVNVVRDLYELSNSDGWCSLQMRSGYGGTRFKGNDSHHKWKWEFFGVEVEESASWGLDGQWRMPDTHLANRQDYALSDAEEKLKATILKQRRPADVLTHPGRLWLCGLAPRPTKMSGIADFQFGKCNPLRVGKQNIIVNCRGERGRLFIEKEVVGQDYQIVVRSASRFVGSGVPVNPEGSVRHPGRGKGVMGLSNLSSAIEQEAATQPTSGDHHANDRQAFPRKDTINLATIQRLRAEKKAAANAEKSSTSAVVKDHVAAAISSARQATPPALEVAPTGVGNRVAQQPASSVTTLPKGASGLMDELELTLKKLKKAVQKEKDKEKRQKEAALKDMAELQEVKMAKKMEEDARSTLEQEKLGRQADKVAASKDKAALEAQVTALESKLQNDFIEVLDAAVVSARHMASKHMGVDLSDVPLENPEFPEGYELPACLRPLDASTEMEDRVNLEDQADRSSHSGSKRQRTK